MNPISTRSQVAAKQIECNQTATFSTDCPIFAAGDSLTSFMRNWAKSPAMTLLAQQLAIDICIQKRGCITDLLHAKNITAMVVTPIVAHTYTERGNNPLKLACCNEKELALIVYSVFSQEISQEAYEECISYVCLDDRFYSKRGEKSAKENQSSRTEMRDSAMLANSLFAGHVSRDDFINIINKIYKKSSSTSFFSYETIIEIINSIFIRKNKTPIPTRSKVPPKQIVFNQAVTSFTECPTFAAGDSLTAFMQNRPANPAMTSLAKQLAIDICIQKKGFIADLMQEQNITAMVVTPIVAHTYTQRGKNPLNLLSCNEQELALIVYSVFSREISKEACEACISYVCLDDRSGSEQEGKGAGEKPSPRTEMLDSAMLAKSLFEGHVSTADFTKIVDEIYGKYSFKRALVPYAKTMGFLVVTGAALWVELKRFVLERN